MARNAAGDAFYRTFCQAHGLPYVSVVYEDMLHDLSGTVSSIIGFLKIDDGQIDYQRIQPRLKRQNDERKAQWTERYKAERGAR